MQHDLVQRRLAPALARSILALPGRQRLVAQVLIGGTSARTYPEVGGLLGMHLGTVHTHLRRMRLKRPDTYAALMGERKQQLGDRHEAALARAEAHSREWHRKQADRR